MAQDRGTGDFYYNPATGEVEQGKVSPWTDRMGPYRSRAEAEQALELARARTESWDEEDRRWREE